MKNIIIRSLSLLLLMILASVGMAQDSIDTTVIIDTIVNDTITVPGTGTLPPLEDWFNTGAVGLMAGLMVVIGYLGKFIPGLNKIKDTQLRLIVFVVLLGTGYTIYGGQIWEVAIAYLGATQAYDKFFKTFIGGSPKNDGTVTERSKVVS